MGVPLAMWQAGVYNEIAWKLSLRRSAQCDHREVSMAEKSTQAETRADDQALATMGRSGRRWWRIVGLLAAFLGVVVVMLWQLRMAASGRFDECVRQIRAKGYPTTLAELNALYPAVPDDENAAVLIESTFGRIADGGGTANLPIANARVTLPKPEDAVPAEMREAIDTYVAAHEAAIVVIRQGLQRPRCRYPVDFAAADRGGRNYFHGLQKATRLIGLDVLHHTFAGRTDEAIDALATLIALAESLKDEPDVLAYLVRRNVYDDACVVAEQMLSRLTFTDQQLQRLSKLFVLDDREHLKRALIGEQCVIIENSQHWDGFVPELGRDVSRLFSYRALDWAQLKDTANATASAAMYFTYPLRGGPASDAAVWLKQSQGYIDACALPMEDQWRVSQSANAMFSTAWKCDDQNTMTARHLLLSGVCGVPGLIVGDLPRVPTRLACARAAIAVERYRLAKGELPATLATLVPEYLAAVPKDPYVPSAASVIYLRRDVGYAIYSVGPDGRDDHGAEFQRIAPIGLVPMANGDIVVSVGR